MSWITKNLKFLLGGGGVSTVSVWGLSVVYLFIPCGQSLFTLVQKYTVSLIVLYYFGILVQSVIIPKLIIELGY